MPDATRVPPQSVQELLIRALALQGRRVEELAQALGVGVPTQPQRAKGFVGQLVERALGADEKAGERPDFPSLGVELKTIPVNAAGQPAETTFCCSLSMLGADREIWETSRLRQRLARVLWVPVQASKIAPLAARRFGRAVMWTPSAAQSAALRADWEDLMGAVGAGRGAFVSAREGQVLQLRPKAAHGGVRTLSPAADGVAPSLPLGFYLRTSFTRQILAGGEATSESNPNGLP